MSHAPSNPVSGIRYTKPRATVNSRKLPETHTIQVFQEPAPVQTPRCSLLLASRSPSDLARNSSALPMHNLSFPNRQRNSSRKALSVATGPWLHNAVPFPPDLSRRTGSNRCRGCGEAEEGPTTHGLPRGSRGGRVCSAALLPAPDEQPAI